MSNLLSFVTSVIKPAAMEFVAVKSLTFEPVHEGVIHANLSINLRNPNSLSILLESYNLNLSCHQTLLGNTNGNPDQEIVAQQVFTLDLRLNLEARALQEVLRRDVAEVLTSGLLVLPFQVDGKATLRKFGFSVDLPLKFTHTLELTLDQLLQKLQR